MTGRTVTSLAAAMLLASTAAYAATTHKTTAHPAAKTHAMHKTAMHKSSMHKAAMHKAAWHGKTHALLHKTDWKRTGTPEGDREVRALNALEAAGYRTIKDIHPDGTNIAASVLKPGKSQAAKKVMVTPAGKILPQA